MPKKQSPILNVPYPSNPFFTGRSQVLDDLRRELAAGGKVALSGMGGVGKTQTAVQYGYSHRDEYKVVLWAKADSEDSLKRDLASIAARLGLPEKDETDRDMVVSAVKRWLEAQTDWLLILDNADDLGLVADLLRREYAGHLLLTTRSHATGSISGVELKVMEPEEGALFLLRRVKLIAVNDALGAATEADRQLAEEITKEVRGLPLALDQAGAFIEGMSSSLGEYLRLYKKEGETLRAERGGVTSVHDSVTLTFSLAFQQVEREQPTAADMLRACAFLSPDAIPEEIFVRGAAELGENLAPLKGGGLNLIKIIGEAGRFSLIQRNVKSGTISIHRLVQQVLQDEMDVDSRRLWAERVVRGLYKASPTLDHKTWPLCEKFLPHWQEAARLIEEYDLQFEDAARLLNKAGFYCSERAQYSEAEDLYVRSLSIRERVLNPDHTDVATSLSNLALVYDAQAKYAEAVSLQLRALSIREKTVGPDHLDVSLSLNNLAHIYNNQGKDIEAESLYIRSLSIRERVLGPDHPDVGLALSNLASVYNRQDRMSEAGPLLERALSISEKAFGPDHPNITHTLNNLATLYEKQGKYTEAESLYIRSLSIRERVLGPDHPDVGVILNNLAGLYHRQDQDAEAESLLKRALSIGQKALGLTHPNVAMCLHNIARLYSKQGRYVEAEPLYVQALSIVEKAFKPDHPHVLLFQKNYAELRRKVGAQD